VLQHGVWSNFFLLLACSSSYAKPSTSSVYVYKIKVARPTLLQFQFFKLAYFKEQD